VKKYVLAMLLIMFCFLFAEKVKLLGLPNIRTAPNSKASVTTNAVIYDVLDVYGDYYKVKVTEGSDNVGKIGWAWVGGLDMGKDIATAKDAKIKKPGLILRAKPTKNSDKVCLVKEGASVDIIECKVTWYKIALGWIYKGAVKVIK